jgi:uncharacterized RDD family membrane protein YckC
VTQANDDAATAGRQPTGEPVRAPATPPTGGPPGFPQPTPYGPAPGHPPYYGPAPGHPPYYGPPQPYGWRPPPGPLSPDGRPLADFGTRLLAHLVDGAMLTGIAMVIALPVFFIVGLNLMPDFAGSTTQYSRPEYDSVFGELFVTFLLLELGFVVLLLVGYYVYYVEMMFRSGQTVGKKVMKIQVVPIEPGATMTRGVAAKRYLVEFIGGVFVPFFSYLDGLWQLWDKPYQQTLHDKFAKTVVIKVAP